MTAHQTETAYLRQFILYHDGDECRMLEKSLAQLQRDQRCVERVAWLTALLLLVAVAGIAYAAVLRQGFPYTASGVVIGLLCSLALASLICLAGLAGLLMAYRLKLNRLRQECLQLVVRLLEARFGKPQARTSPANDRVLDVCTA